MRVFEFGVNFMKQEKPIAVPKITDENDEYSPCGRNTLTDTPINSPLNPWQNVEETLLIIEYSCNGLTDSIILLLWLSSLQTPSNIFQVQAQIKIGLFVRVHHFPVAYQSKLLKYICVHFTPLMQMFSQKILLKPGKKKNRNNFKRYTPAAKIFHTGASNSLCTMWTWTKFIL